LLSGPTTSPSNVIHKLLPEPILLCPKEIRSAGEIAGYSAIGQETKDSLRKPFQCGRGVATFYIFTRSPPLSFIVVASSRPAD
jgi:hypothetical protein